MPGKQPAPFDEKAFQAWYALKAAEAGLDPNPDAPEHHYDYRAAFRGGAQPQMDDEDHRLHWPSEYKTDDHPRRFLPVGPNGEEWDTKYNIDAVTSRAPFTSPFPKRGR